MFSIFLFCSLQTSFLIGIRLCIRWGRCRLYQRNLIERNTGLGSGCRLNLQQCVSFLMVTGIASNHGAVSAGLGRSKFHNFHRDIVIMKVMKNIADSSLDFPYRIDPF